MQRGKLLFVAAFLVALITTLLAQTSGILTGTITDTEGKAVIGATIRIIGTSQGGVSKSPDGKFTISNIIAGDYTAKITAVGYQAVERNIRISTGQTTTLNVTLSTQAIQGNTISVTAGREVVRKERTGTTTTISTEELDRSARTSIVSNVELQQGVSTEGVNGVTLRGGRSSETTIKVDGARVDDAFAGGYGNTSASLYPTTSTLGVQEVQVIQSGFSAEYGDVTSGVVSTSTPVLAAEVTREKDMKAAPNGAAFIPQPTVVNTPTVAARKTEQPLSNTSGTIPQDAIGSEQYDAIYENAFMTANINRTSTFSIDVDRASYSNSRRFITAGQRPPRDAVRIEEFINYFSYDYPEPVDEHPFSIFTEVSDCPWDRSHRLVMVGVQGKRVETAKLPPANLVFLIDVSGSMSDPNKLPLVKQGLNLLVDQLREEDNVAMTVYAGAAGLVLPPTSGAKKKEIREALDRLSAGGSTAGGAGIKLAYDVAKQHFRKDGNNRVILMTDGDFNVGTSGDEELVKLIEEKRNDGIFLTVLGFGTGNYKDSKMEKLADNGNGNYAYIDNITEAKKTLVEEMGSTLLAIAKDVKIQIEFNPEAVSSYRLIGYENRMLRKEDFEDDRKDAGELGAGHTVTALYEVVPVGAEAGTRAGGDTLDIPWMKETGELMEVRLRYKQPADSVSQLIEQQVQDRNVRLDKASENLRWAAAVAEFGLLLRHSQHRASASFEDVLRLANGAKGNDASGYRAEFITLVERCKGLPMAAR